MSADTRDELGRSITRVSDLGHLRRGEVASIPQIRKAGAGIPYGPLARLPLRADCVLVRVEAAQAM